MLLKFLAYDWYPRSVTIILPDTQLQLWNHFHTSFNDTSKVEKSSLNLCLPIYPPLSLSLPCQATTLWGHKMGLREWGGNCGWMVGERELWNMTKKRRLDGLEERGGFSWAMTFETGFISLPPLCPLKTSMRGKEQKVDFAIFSSIPSLQSRLRRIHNWQAITTLADSNIKLDTCMVKLCNLSQKIWNYS